MNRFGLVGRVLVCVLGVQSLAQAAEKAGIAAGVVVHAFPTLFAPAKPKTGNYVLRYIESVPDDHLDLHITNRNGSIYLTDRSTVRLQGSVYTINNWTDPEDASRLEDEPIKPYTLYHVTRASIAAPFREWWRSMPEIRQNNPIEIHRSEVFFVVTPSNETWNGVGEGVNPVGRPLAFSKLPAFDLTNRVYGFDGGFPDETEARLDELDITFNRRSGQKHIMIYNGPLETFLKSKGYDQEPRRPVHEFSDQDCIDFADSLPHEGLLAFDFEPPEEWRWATDYGHPGFRSAMGKVIARLKDNGVLAYNWMQSPQFHLDGESLQGFKCWGKGHEQMDLFLKAYAEPDQIVTDGSPNAVINLGFGYDSYDYNYMSSDVEPQNSSPQALYLKALDACELASRVYADRERIAFTWANMEFDVGTFPPNHEVHVPATVAIARKHDNKPIYSPSSWQDSMTLAFLYCRYIFYWGGHASWNPEAVARYAACSLQPGEMEVWKFIKGEGKKVTGGAYAGKEALIFSATISAAYRYSQLQGVCDSGKRTFVEATYTRAAKDGKAGEKRPVPAYDDGSGFIHAAKERQPFTLVATAPGSKKKVVFFQDVWARPGRWTEFSFNYNGKTYSKARNAAGKMVPLRTDGNRLFIGTFE